MTVGGRAGAPPGSFGSNRLYAVAAGGRAARFVRWSLACALVIACNRATSGDAAAAVAYGEPVGVELKGRPPMPPLAIAFAVTRGRDPRPTVASLASALESAAQRCPDFVRAVVGGEAVRFELRATRTTLRARDLPAKKGGPCVKTVLDGKLLELDGAEPIDLLVEVRPVSGDASTVP